MNILAKIGSWRLIFMQIIMCFTIGHHISLPPNIARKPTLGALVNCLDLASSLPAHHHTHNHQRALLRPNETIITKITNLGILQCVARSPQKPPSPLTNSSIKSTSENAAPSRPPSNGPHVIVLPPIPPQAPPEGEYLEEDQYGNEEANLKNGDQDEPPQPEGFIDSEAENEAREMDGPVLAPQKLMTKDRRRRRNKKFYPSISIWNHLKSPIAKLQLAKNSSSRAAAHANLVATRFKRQVANQQPVDPVEQIIRLFLADTNRSRPLVAINLAQQALGSIGAFAGQMTAGLLRQTTEDLPIHVANFGQLMSNVLAALTINNPVIANSPALLRAQQTAGSLSPLALSLGNSSSSSTNTTTIPINTSQTTIRPITRSLEQRLVALDATLRLLRGVARDLLRDRGNRFPGGAATSTTTTPSSFEPLAEDLGLDGEEREMLAEIRMVRKLNELTLGIVPAVNGSRSSVETSGRRRNKRGVGSLLMYGPFSRFYLAMLINKMLRYQSGVLSQAVVSELVRRYVVPGLSSLALGQSAPSLVGLMNQIKQGLTATQNLPVSQQATNLQSASDQSHAQTLLDADCQLVNTLNGDTTPQIPSTDSQALPLAAAPIQLLASALNNPAFSLDEKGLAYNSPLSQNSYLVPNLLTGPYSLQTLLRAYLSASGTDSDSQLSLGNEALSPTNLSNLTSLGGPQFAPPPLHQSSSMMHPMKRLPARGNPWSRPIRKFVSKPSIQYPQQQEHHTLNKNLPRDQQVEDDWLELMEQERGLLLRANSTATDPTAVPLLDLYLKNASPSQLIELMGMSATTGDRGLHPKDLSDGDLAELAVDKSGPKSDRLARLLNEITVAAASSQQQQRTVQSADEIADRILNKTFELGLNNLLNQSKRQPNDGTKLVKDTSDQLAASFAQLIRNLNFENSANGSQRSAAENEKAAKLMDKLMSLANNSDSKQEVSPPTHPALKSTKLPHPSFGQLGADEHPEVVAEEWPQSFDSLRKLDETLKQAPRQMVLDGSDGIPAGPNNRATPPTRNKATADTSDHRWPAGEESIGLTAQNANQNHIVRDQESLGHQKAQKTSPASGGRLVSHLSNGHNLSHSSDTLQAAQVSGVVSLAGVRWDQAGLRKTPPEQKQQQQQQSARARASQLIWVHDIDKGQAFEQPKRLQPVLQSRRGDLNKINKTSSSRLIVSAPSAHTAHNGSVDGGADNKTGSEERNNLNNLAMALNVMNMVLLNQKLANGAGSKGGLSPADNGQPPVQLADGPRLVVGGPTSGAHRMIIGQQRPMRLRPPQPLAGNFVLLPERQPLPLSAGKGRRFRLKNRHRQFPHNLYGQQLVYPPPRNVVHGQQANRGSTNNATSSTGANQSPGPELEREGPIMSNHRMIRNKIKLNSNVMIQAPKEEEGGPRGANRTINYHYQPLQVAPESGGPNNAAGGRNKSTSGQQAAGLEDDQQQQPESEHATRWNDVLQHLNLS